MSEPRSESARPGGLLGAAIVSVSVLAIVGVFVHHAFQTREWWVVVSIQKTRLRDAEEATRALEAECDAMELELLLSIDLDEALRRDSRRLALDLPPPATDLQWATAVRDAAVTCSDAFERRRRGEP